MMVSWIDRITLEFPTQWRALLLLVVYLPAAWAADGDADTLQESAILASTPSILELAHNHQQSEIGSEGDVIPGPESESLPEDITAAASPGAETVGGDSNRSSDDDLTEAESASRLWIDEGHGFMTERTNNLTQWFDSYFGDTESDQEVASSRLRLRFINDWDERDGNAVRVRLGGKVNLPQISKRLDLVFQGDDPGDQINGEDDPSQSRLGLQYQVGNERSKNHRFDLTVGISSSGPRPGVKYRYQQDLSKRNSLRFTQRVQYELDDGVSSTSRLELEHRLSSQEMLRSYTRLLWGENTDGQELSTALQWVKFFDGHGVNSREVTPQAFIAYGEVWAVTEPYEYISNYRLGMRFRRQTFRDYLFVEFEPSYNWRIDEPYLPRRGAWRVEVRAEFLLFDDLRQNAD